MPGEGPVVPADSSLVADALARLTIGVSIVATSDGKVDHGCTGMAWGEHGEPPLLLTTLSRRSRTWRMVTDVGMFSVSVLSAHQAPVAERFAGIAPGAAPSGEDRFANVEHSRGKALGMPLVSGAVAHLECHVDAVHPFGAYDVVIGRVADLHTDPDRSPLVHFARSLWALKPTGAWGGEKS